MSEQTSTIETRATDTLLRFHIKTGGNWGHVLIDTQHSQVFSMTGWGDYCYQWGGAGPDFIEFLISLGEDYAMSKFTYGRKETGHTKGQARGFWREIWMPLMVHLKGVSKEVAHA